MRQNNFLPASKYYGDKYPRTMEEAFGPGAELTTQYEQDSAFSIIVGLALTALAGLIAWSSWALTA